MADWERALDKQLATYLFWHGPIARDVAEYWVNDVNAKYGSDEKADRMMEETRALLWKADPIWVTPDMCDLLEAAYQTFEPETITADDLIIRDGFALLPRVLYVPDIWGKRTAVRAMAWRSILRQLDSGDVVPGVNVNLFCNADDTDDYWTEENRDDMRKAYGDAMALVVDTQHMFGEDVDAKIARTLALRTDRHLIDDEQARFSIMSEIRLLQCFWRLTKQQIAVGFRQRPNRAARKRSERAEYPDKYVTVVTLRRPRSESAEPEHHAVDWKMRWIVSGHWRWQWYPSSSTHRQIWVAPYVKGPESAPLAVRKMRVFQWSR